MFITSIILIILFLFLDFSIIFESIKLDNIDPNEKMNPIIPINCFFSPRSEIICGRNNVNVEKKEK